MTDTRKGDWQTATNPKDVIGSTKAPVGLVPDTIVLGAVESFLEGALKYGRYNWRIAGVRASIYNDALERHRMKWWNGQNADKATKVHHLKSIIACAGIMLDAIQHDKLIDDRPPCADPDAYAEYIDSLLNRVAELKELFKDHNPHQFTIADTPRPAPVELTPEPPVVLVEAGTVCKVTAGCWLPAGHAGHCD